MKSKPASKPRPDERGFSSSFAVKRVESIIHPSWIVTLALILIGVLSSHSLQSQDEREIWVPNDHLEAVLKKMPRAVFLTPEQYQKLRLEFQQAKSDPDKNALPPPVSAVIRSAKYKGTVTAGTDVVVLAVTYEVECFTDEWTEVPLALPRDQLGHISIDANTALRVTPNAKDKKNPPILLTHGKGKHTVVANYHLPITRLPNGNLIVIKSPGVPASLELSLPESADLESQLPFIRKNGTATFALPSERDKAHEIRWTAQKVAAIPGAAVLQTCSYLYSLDSTSLQADLGMIINSALTDLPTQFEIGIPKEFRVLRVEGEELLRWTRKANGVVSVDLVAGDRDTTDIRLRVERDVPDFNTDNPDVALTLPVASIEGIHRASGTMTLVGSEDIRVKKIETGPLTVPIPDDEEGPATNLPNYIASFRFPVSNDPPSVTLSKIQSRFNAQLDTLISLEREAVNITRTLTILPLEGTLFSAAATLSSDEEIVTVTTATGTEANGFDWTADDDNRILLTWDVGLTQATPATITIQSRLDPEGWFNLSNDSMPLLFSATEIESVEASSGYLAVAFDESFQVETTATTGLEPRDARTTPISGTLAWFRLNEFDLEIAARRRPPELEASIISYALPLANTIEIEGQIDLEVRYSGIEQLAVSFPEEVSSLVRFDSPLIAEQTLGEDNSTWTLRFHQERKGDARIRYSLVIPFEGLSDSSTGEKKDNTFAVEVPRIDIPAAKRIRGDWIMEANTDTELDFHADGLDRVDSLRVPTVSGYQPRHRIIAAFSFRGNEWELNVNGTRHPHSEVVTAVIDSLRLDTVVSVDGADRHQAKLAMRSTGEQFLELNLPPEAVVWTLLVDDETVKPVRAGENTLRVQLPAHENTNQQINIHLIYQTPGKEWRGSGREKLNPIRVTDSIPVMETEWFLHLPEGYDYQKFRTNLGQEFEVVDRLLLGEAGKRFGEGIGEISDGFRHYSYVHTNEAEMPMAATSADEAASTSFYSSIDDITLDSKEKKSGGVPTVATTYVIRMQERVKKADEAALRGSQLMSDSDHEGAIDQYRTALNLLPRAPMTDARRKAYVKQFSRSSALLAGQRAEEGRYPESIALVEEVLQPTVDPENTEANRLLDQLNDPDFYSPALTPAHLEKTRKLKLAVKSGQGYIALGDFTRADAEFNTALNQDPYNGAARTGIESSERNRMDYYDVARNQTRSEFLKQVAEGWEVPVPSRVAGGTGIVLPQDSTTTQIRMSESKLKSIILPSVEFAGTPLRDALAFLTQRSVELDTNETDPAKKGINIVLDAGFSSAGAPPPGNNGGSGSQTVADTPITLRLTNVPIAEAIRYTTALAQLKYKVEPHAIVVTPLSTPDSDLYTNVYKVPPTFLSRGGMGGGGGGGAAADPFAAPADSGTAVASTRQSAKNILESAGITFGTGSSAIYNKETGQLIVRNTQDQMDLVDAYQESILGGAVPQAGADFGFDANQPMEPGARAKPDQQLEGSLALGGRDFDSMSRVGNDLAALRTQNSTARIREEGQWNISKVQEDWGFVVLNGDPGSTASQGARMNVYRAGKPIARLLVTSVEDGQVVADIIPGSIVDGETVSVGDAVIGSAGASARYWYDGNGGVSGSERGELPYLADLPLIGRLFANSEKIGNRNEKLLRELTVEDLDFDGVSLEEAADILNTKLAEAAGDKYPAAKGLSVELTESQGKTDALGLKLGKITVLDALDKLTGATDTHYRVTASGIVIAPQEVSLEPMESVFIPLPATKFQTVGTNGETKQTHARNILVEAGIEFPPGSSAAYNPVSGRLAVKNTRANLEAVVSLYADDISGAHAANADENERRFSKDFLGGASTLRGFDYRDVGKRPLKFELPESGRSYRFSGLYAPEELTFRFVNWERQIRFAWIWILIGGLAFWFGAWRKMEQPVFLGIAGIIALTFIPLLITSSLSGFCNALLIGWIAAMFLTVIYHLSRKVVSHES